LIPKLFHNISVAPLDQKILEQIQDFLESNHGVLRVPERFYKTKPGDYGEHDLFLGITTPCLRSIASKIHKAPEKLSFKGLSHLMTSSFNEVRLLALFILINGYNDPCETLSGRKRCFDFYQEYLPWVNNWNLVDASAHWIVGAYLFETNQPERLLDIACSDHLWKRRIAIVSTWYFIKKNDLKWTLTIAEILLKDPHDLIHKATGWMLREVGKKDIACLKIFLNSHRNIMHSTTLRYSIEKMSLPERCLFLQKSPKHS
jgi:3-methyladenine DNA glycosylase AlkD